MNCAKKPAVDIWYPFCSEKCFREEWADLPTLEEEIMEIKGEGQHE